jgi:hypothetical protein
LLSRGPLGRGAYARHPIHHRQRLAERRPCAWPAQCAAAARRSPLRPPPAAPPLAPSKDRASGTTPARRDSADGVRHFLTRQPRQNFEHPAKEPPHRRMRPTESTCALGEVPFARRFSVARHALLRRRHAAVFSLLGGIGVPSRRLLQRANTAAQLPDALSETRLPADGCHTKMKATQIGAGKDDQCRSAPRNRNHTGVAPTVSTKP